MGFQQLYYTSCERGLSGYTGYQFNAATADVAPDAMREVERFTVYEVPRSAAPDRPGEHPVNLCYTPDADGSAILARVVSAGLDPSGRPGNYFAHALIPTGPRDLDQTLPAELWDAPFWHEAQSEGTVLAELAGPLPNGPCDRGAVAERIGAQAQRMLPALLTAVDGAIGGDRPVLLVATSANAAHWIAAVSFLLEPRRARQMSFATYTQHPDYAPVQVMGVLPEAGREFSLDGGTYAVFHPGSGEHTEIDRHPLAHRLAAAGPGFCETLWQEAGEYSSGREASLTDWHPVVAAAGALRLGTGLDEADLAAVTAWLPGAADRLPAGETADLLALVLDKALDATRSPLEAAALAALHRVAEQSGARDARDRLEQVMVARSLERIAAGHSAGAPAVIESPAVLRAAAERASALLRGSAAAGPVPLPVGAALLEWAAKSGVEVYDEAVEHYGRTAVAPAMLNSPAMDADAEWLMRSDAAIRAGAAAKIDGLGEEQAARVLAGPVGGLFDEADLEPFPALEEAKVVTAAHRSGDLSGALVRVIRVRRAARERSAQDAPRNDADAALLAALCRYRHEPATAAPLLEPLRAPDIRVARDVGDWVAEALVPVPEEDQFEDWTALVQQLREHRVRDYLPGPARDVMTEAVELMSACAGLPEVADASAAVGRLSSLYPLLDAAPPAVRAVMLSKVLAVLAGEQARTEVLPQAFAECPGYLFEEFCAFAAQRIGDPNPDVRLASVLFQVAHDRRFSRSRSKRAERLERQCLAATVPHWAKRDIAAMREQLSGRFGAVFEEWRVKNKVTLGDRAGGFFSRFTGRGGDHRR